MSFSETINMYLSLSISEFSDLTEVPEFCAFKGDAANLKNKN